MEHTEAMRQAVELSRQNILLQEGGPFGCIIIKDGAIVGRGRNRVIVSNDPTAHAEIEAIRDACKRLGTHQLTGCILYTSCEPCPMCLGAIYWARPDAVFFANSRQDAAKIGFDDEFIYSEIEVDIQQRKIPFTQIDFPKARDVFQAWVKMDGRPEY